MKKIDTILTLLIILLLNSCDSKDIKNKTADSNNKKISIDSTMKTKMNTSRIVDDYKPEVFLLNYSECKENCNDYERIISKKYTGDSLLLKVGLIQNCIGKFRLEIEKHEEKLNLNIKVKEEIIKRKNGKVDTILITNDCDCYFYFNIGIKNIDKEFKTILVNGKNLTRQRNTSNINDQIIFIDPENPPIYINGGDAGLKLFIKENLKYPTTGENVTGKVYVGFSVDTLGNTKDIEIKRGITKSTDEEAMRIAKLLKFIPGSLNGKPIETKMIILIDFSMNYNDKEE
jgi:hypothetical protein